MKARQTVGRGGVEGPVRLLQAVHCGFCSVKALGIIAVPAI